MARDAYTMGVAEDFYDEGYGVDWDRLLRSFEVGDIDLGDDSDSPLIRRIKAAYRKGRKESET